MQATQALTRRSLNQLEEDIVSLSERINATEYEFLVLVREFDLRQGWKICKLSSCAEWLNYKCGIKPGTAREKVRVARALFDLPVTSGAFQQGALSYSKARSITRIAAPDTEQNLVDYALLATAQQVDKHCRDLRNTHRELSTPDANRLHQQRYLSHSRHGDGSISISVELPAETGELVIKALEYAIADIEANAGRECVCEGEDSENNHTRECGARTSDTLFQRQADALVTMARGYMAGGKEKTNCTADHYQVVVHVDENALRGAPDENSKSELPIETVRRLCCDSSVVALTEDENGDPLHVGRRHRIVPPSMRRALLARDRCCRFPGCTHQKWLAAHHVKHWADGGETSMDNCILLCSSHHLLLHEGGFCIKKDCNGQFQFGGNSRLDFPAVASAK